MADSEASSRGTDELEATRTIKALSMWVPNDVNGCRALQARHRHATIDQLAADPLAPGTWVDKECVKLRVAIFARKQCCKSLDRPGDLSDINLAVVDLSLGEVDGVRIGKDRLAI